MKILLEFGGISHLHGSAVGKGGELSLIHIYGEMIITWKNQEGTFNTQPLTRKIRLHWDNLRDGYYIAFDSQGGSYVDTIMGKYNSDIEKPEDPVRTGYRFAGWYEDEELTTPYTIPAKMPNKERMVYAKWEAEDVGYQVVEYLEGTNGCLLYTSPSYSMYRPDRKAAMHLPMCLPER